jgi:hypothetical protein
MRWQVFFKAAGIIVSAALTIFSLIQNAQGITTLWGHNVSWQWWTVWGFVAFVVFMLWIVIGLILDNRKLRLSKPSIVVSGSRFNLMVTNLGAEAKFTARISISKGYQPDSNIFKYYDGYWEKTQHYESPIMKGNVDNIMIAGTYLRTIIPPVSGLEMYFYDPNLGSMRGRLPLLDSISNDQQEQPKFELEVTITSNPEMSKIYTEWYTLDRNGLEFIEKRELKGK